MIRTWTIPAFIALAVMAISGCSKTQTSPAKPEANATSLPEGDGDSGDKAEVGAAPSPSASEQPAPQEPAVPPRGEASAPYGFSASDDLAENQPAAQAPEPAEPSIYRSLGRALTKGMAGALGRDPQTEAPESDDDSETPPTP